MFTQQNRRIENLRRRFGTYVMFLLYSMLLMAPAASAQADEKLIDDFTTGAYTVALETGDDDHLESGLPENPIGGTRCTYFGFRGADNPLDQTAILDIRNGRLVVNTGPEVHHGLMLSYGFVSHCNNPAPLNLNLSGFQRFRVHFRFLDLPTVVAIRLDSPAGSSSMFKEVDPGRNFNVDLPFADFVGTADFRNLSHIAIVTDSRGRFESHDYVITSIKAVP